MKEKRDIPYWLIQILRTGCAAYRGDRGLKGAIDASGVQVVVLPVGETGGVIASARREKEFELIAEKQFPQDIHPRVKVQLVKNEAFFGPGMMVLLEAD